MNALAIATEIYALINSRPQSPSIEEIAALIDRSITAEWLAKERVRMEEVDARHEADIRKLEAWVRIRARALALPPKASN